MALQQPNPCLRVTITEWPPLSVKVGPFYGGVAVDVVRLVAGLHRYCVSFQNPPDEFWGMEYPNGSWSGMIGEVNRSEADMSGTLIFVSEPRSQVVDFSFPLFFQEHRIMYKTPKLKPNIAGFLMPFTPIVWVSTIAIIVAMTVALALLFRLYDSNWNLKRQSKSHKKMAAGEPGWRSFQFMVRSLFAQPLYWKPPTENVILFATGLWLFIAFVLGTMYKSNLKSMIILPKVRIPFETLEQLVSQDEYKYVMAGGGSLHQQALESSPNTVLGRLIRKVCINNDMAYVYHLVTNKHYAGIANEIHLEAVLHEHYSVYGKCEHTITKTGFVTGMQLSFVFQKNSPLRAKFNKVILRLREAGILDYMLARALSNASHCKKKVKTSGELRPLAFWDVAGMLSVFAAGISISLLVFAFEVLWKPKRRSPALRDAVEKIFRVKKISHKKPSSFLLPRSKGTIERFQLMKSKGKAN